MSSELDKYGYGTAVSVTIQGDYLRHDELASLLDELGEHFFTVEARKNNWEGPMADGSEVVMWITVTSATVLLTTILTELAKDAYQGLRTKIVDTWHKAAGRKRRARREPSQLVIEAENVPFLLAENGEPLTEEDLAKALRAAADELQAHPKVEAERELGPLDTYPVWDRHTNTWIWPRVRS